MGYFTVFLFIAIVFADPACEYKEFGADHVMCKYEENKCKLDPRGFSKADSETMVKLLNKKRQLVASGNQTGLPSASNMNQLVWDEELAKIAQRFTDQCTMLQARTQSVPQVSNMRSKKYPVVENLIYIFQCPKANSALKVGDVVSFWFREAAALKAEHISPFKASPTYYRYSQMVWAQTEAVGCGFGFNHKEDKSFKYIACLFGPGGNIAKGEVYKLGEACSACPSGCSTEYSALCTLESQHAQ